MKYLLSLLPAFLFLFEMSSSTAQDCNALIRTNEFDDHIHLLETVLLKFEGAHKCTPDIKFLHNKYGIIANIHTKCELEFYPNDEIFMSANENKDRKHYKFTDSGMPDGQNFIKLGLADLEWLSNMTVKTIYLKSNIQNKMWKYSLNPTSQSSLKGLATCFSEKLD